MMDSTGLSNALATSRRRLRLRLRPLTVFDSLLALFCFVIYLTIICAACPTPPPTQFQLALPPRFLQLLEQWALRGKTRKVVVLFLAELFLLLLIWHAERATCEMSSN